MVELENRTDSGMTLTLELRGGQRIATAAELLREVELPAGGASG